MNEDFKEVQDMLEQAKDLVKTLENKYNELNKPKNNIRWRAKNNGIYFCIKMFDKIHMAIELLDSSDDFLYSIGNYFKTEQEAEKYKAHLIITQQLKGIALRLNDGVEIDWSCNTSQRKYQIILDTRRNKLTQDWNEWTKRDTAYCLSDKFLETAIKEIGEKELIEYIKGN